MEMMFLYVLNHTYLKKDPERSQVLKFLIPIAS